jgi:hypothetical protein
MAIKSAKQSGIGGIDTSLAKSQGELAIGGAAADINGYKLHTYTATGTFTALKPLVVEYLIVAGGGSAGSALYHGGGGGAGGVITGISCIQAGTYTVTVGAGGSTPGSSGFKGNNGNYSSFAQFCAIGGGGSGVYACEPGRNGGSGGGGGAQANVSATSGAGCAGQGYCGGNFNGAASGNKRGGGGGGALCAGVLGGDATGGQGGDGIASFISGKLYYYAGGGGGSAEVTTVCQIGGKGGGGNGNWNAGENGHLYTGGGGGAGERTSPATSGNGGSGIVYLRYKKENTTALTLPIVTDCLTYFADPGSSVSYSPTINVVAVRTYSTFGNTTSPTRSANYTVQYSDDNSIWTTAFTGVMSNNGTTGIQEGSGTGNGSYGYRRYWRYVEGSAVVNHHPRVSRIMLVDKNGIEYTIVKYVDDNKFDSGEYQIGTITMDVANKVFDISDNNNTTTVNNGTIYSSGNGGYFSFDATNDYLNASTFYKHQTTTGTIAGWAYPTEATSDRYVMGVGGNGVTGTNRAIRVNSGNWSTVSYGSSTEDFNSIVTAQLNTWQYVVFAWNGTNVYFYFNGVQYTTTRSGMVTPTGTQITIGLPSWSGSTSWWSGRIGPVQVYNKTLSQAEVTQNFNAMRGRFGI